MLQYILIPGVLTLVWWLMFDRYQPVQSTESIGVCPCGSCVSLPDFINQQ